MVDDVDHAPGEVDRRARARGGRATARCSCSPPREDAPARDDDARPARPRAAVEAIAREYGDGAAARRACSRRAAACPSGSTAPRAAGPATRPRAGSAPAPTAPPSERARLRAAEDDLAASVVELQAASERAEPRPPHELVACPFKGLATFDVDDADVFFGRERLVAEMVARLAGAPLLGIVGPSGSGKSSALRAGLLPALAAGVLPGSDGWAIALLRPGAHPLARARAGDRAARRPRAGW